MDIQNNSVVTDVDTEILDGEITQISNDFSETYYFDGEQEEELEMLVAKAMKLGELYERKKWQAAKAQAVPEGFVLVPKEPYAYLIKHKLWKKDSDPEIFLAVDFLGNDGVERDKLTVCMPLYLGDDEAQEPAND